MTYSSSLDIQTLKESVDIHTLLFSLGFKITNENSKEIRCRCAIHGGDNKSAFRFNKVTRTWLCFTHKCHIDHGYDIIGLIKGTLRVDFVGAVNFLKTLVGDNLVSNTYITAQKFSKDKDSFIKNYAKAKKPDYVSEDHLHAYKSLRSQCFVRSGFSKATLDYFEIAGGFTDKWGILRDIVPIRDVNGKLQAYSLRDTRRNPPDDDYKYIITEGFVKDSVLYNLHNAKLYCNYFPLILVEGFKSVWRLYDYGIYNAVCVMGSFVTEGQLELLKTYALNGIVLFFDADKAGREGAALAEVACKKKNIKCFIETISLSDVEKEEDGPAELTCEQVYRYLNAYIR